MWFCCLAHWNGSVVLSNTEFERLFLQPHCEAKQQDQMGSRGTRTRRRRPTTSSREGWFVVRCASLFKNREEDDDTTTKPLHCSGLPTVRGRHHGDMGLALRGDHTMHESFPSLVKAVQEELPDKSSLWCFHFGFVSGMTKDEKKDNTWNGNEGIGDLCQPIGTPSRNDLKDDFQR